MNAKIEDWTPDEYHAQTGYASRGGIVEATRSFRVYHGRYVTGTLEREPSTAPVKLGNYGHDAVLLPDRFASHYVIEPPWDQPAEDQAGDEWDAQIRLRPKFTGKGARELAKSWEADVAASGKRSASASQWASVKRELWREDNAGLESITPREQMLCLGMQTAVNAHPVASRLVAGDNEQSVTWTDFDSGLRCKTLRDARPAPGFLVDLKTTFDPSPDAFARTAAKGLLHVQDAFYTLGEAVLLGVPWHEVAPMTFVVVRSVPPHEVALYTLPSEARYAGMEIVSSALNQIAARMKSDNWANAWEHAPNHQPVLVQWPAWALNNPLGSPTDD